jgi:hypothetical protein
MINTSTIIEEGDPYSLGHPQLYFMSYKLVVDNL